MVINQNRKAYEMDIMITVWDNGAHTCGTGSSAYSDMVMIAGNKVAILYEAGVSRPYEGIAYKIISPDDFK